MRSACADPVRVKIMSLLFSSRPGSRDQLASGRGALIHRIHRESPPRQLRQGRAGDPPIGGMNVFSPVKRSPAPSLCVKLTRNCCMQPKGCGRAYFRGAVVTVNSQRRAVTSGGGRSTPILTFARGMRSQDRSRAVVHRHRIIGAMAATSHHIIAGRAPPWVYHRGGAAPDIEYACPWRWRPRRASQQGMPASHSRHPPDSCGDRSPLALEAGITGCAVDGLHGYRGSCNRPASGWRVRDQAPGAGRSTSRWQMHRASEMSRGAWRLTRRAGLGWAVTEAHHSATAHHPAAHRWPHHGGHAVGDEAGDSAAWARMASVRAGSVAVLQ